MNSDIPTVTVEKRPMRGLKNRKHLTKNEKVMFAKELIRRKGNQTQAYQAVRVDVNEGTARTQASRLVRSNEVKDILRDVLKNNGLSLDETTKYLKTAITSGLGKKATNKDSISGLKILMDIHQGKENDDLEALHEADLREQSHAELSKQLDNIVKEIKQLKREGAEEGEIVQ